MGYRGSQWIHLRGQIIQTSWAQIVTLLSLSMSFSSCRMWGEQVFERAAWRHSAHKDVGLSRTGSTICLSEINVSPEEISQQELTQWNSENCKKSQHIERLPLLLCVLLFLVGRQPNSQKSITYLSQKVQFYNV